MSIIQEIEQEQLARLGGERAVPDFGPGDTLRVNVKVVEGTRERIQAFEGVCIARKNAGVNSSFTVRKISYGEGVERIFPLYSPRIDSIEVMRRGHVRRAKLYYLRGRTGKRARIAEKTTVRGTGGAGAAASKEKEYATAEEAYEAQQAPTASAEAPSPETSAAGGGKKATAGGGKKATAGGGKETTAGGGRAKKKKGAE